MTTLVIRFSSFGDILQALPVTPCFKGSVVWLTKTKFKNLIINHPNASQVICLEEFKNLTDLAKSISVNEYDYIYDIHNNLRSNILRLAIIFQTWILWKKKSVWVTRPKNRFKRWLLFNLRINWLPAPFIGTESFLKPIRKLPHYTPPIKEPSLYLKEDIPVTLPEGKFVCLAPSAAWKMKRWPLAKWKELIAHLPQTQICILGGPGDHFCEDLVQIAPDRITNLAGKLTLEQSCLVVAKASLLVAADTGLMHAADQMRTPCISLIGPTAFGFPYNDTSIVLKSSLKCMPCSKDGRGKCVQKVFQQCMLDITATQVAQTITKMDSSLV